MSERFDKDGKPVTNGQGPKAARPAGPGVQQPSSSQRPSQYPTARPAAAPKAPAPAAAPKAAAPVVKRAEPAAGSAPKPESAARSGAGIGAALREGAGKAGGKVGAVASSAREQVALAQQADPSATKGAAGARGPRRARLRLSRIDPWSVAKVSFLLSVALGVVAFVAVLITWSVMGAAGVWDAINSVAATVASNSDGTSNFDVTDYVGTGRVLGLTLVVSVVNVFLLTAMATLGAFLYNMAAALLGGVEVTLSEDDD